MLTIRAYHVTYYSDYMAELIWNTIEIRIVCIVDSFDIPLKAFPENIFKALQYEDLMQGSINETYFIEERAKTT